MMLWMQTLYAISSHISHVIPLSSWIILRFATLPVRCTQKIPKKHLASVRLKKPMHRRRSHGFRGAAWLFLALAAAVLDVFNVFDAPAFTNAVRTQIASLASNVGVDLKSRTWTALSMMQTKTPPLQRRLFDGLHGRSPWWLWWFAQTLWSRHSAGLFQLLGQVLLHIFYIILSCSYCIHIVIYILLISY